MTGRARSLFVSLTAAICVLAACDRDRARFDQRVVVGGSSALLPLVRHAAQRFTEQHPTIAIDVLAGGSTLGLEQVSQGAIDIGNLDSGVDDTKRLVDRPVAITVLAVASAAGPHLPTGRSLTTRELEQIFSGAITDWAAVGGKPGPIFVVDRPRGSGTRSVFAQVFFGGSDRFVRNVPIEDNAGTVARTLVALPGSISYVSLPYVRPPLVALAIDGVAPSKQTVMDGTYRFWSRGHMVTQPNARRVVNAFVDFVLSDEFQGHELEQLGYLPIASVAALGGKP